MAAVMAYTHNAHLGLKNYAINKMRAISCTAVLKKNTDGSVFVNKNHELIFSRTIAKLSDFDTYRDLYSPSSDSTAYLRFYNFLLFLTVTLFFPIDNGIQAVCKMIKSSGDLGSSHCLGCGAENPMQRSTFYGARTCCGSDNCLSRLNNPKGSEVALATRQDKGLVLKVKSIFPHVVGTILSDSFEILNSACLIKMNQDIPKRSTTIELIENEIRNSSGTPGNKLNLKRARQMVELLGDADQKREYEEEIKNFLVMYKAKIELAVAKAEFEMEFEAEMADEPVESDDEMPAAEME